MPSNWNSFCSRLLAVDRKLSPPFETGELSDARNLVYSVGLVVGLIARAILPAHNRWVSYYRLLGMAGSFVGGYLGALFRGNQGMVVSDPYNWIGAIIGSLLLLFLYGMVAGRKTSV